MLRVFYSRAHSGGGDWFHRHGAMTIKGMTEAQVARTAEEPFVEHLRQQGIECFVLEGRLRDKIERTNRMITEARRDGCAWCTVELHFNATPLQVCPACDYMRFMGAPCQVCGHRPNINWAIGHKAMVSRYSQRSLALAGYIMDELDKVVRAFSRRRPTIRIPMPGYSRGLWPRTVTPPAALIELGFNIDPAFADWIHDRVSQVAYGMMAAEGIIEWYLHEWRDKKDVDLSSWHE
jgi:hypothetical protein